MPTRIVTPKPSLVPSGILISEIPDLWRAIVSFLVLAYHPFRRPVDTGSAHFGPERQPFSVKYTCDCTELSRLCLDVKLIAPAGRRNRINRFVALWSVTIRCI
jgi:hypothetical protein